jgi:hypothetical protein
MKILERYVVAEFRLERTENGTLKFFSESKLPEIPRYSLGNYSTPDGDGPEIDDLLRNLKEGTELIIKVKENPCK